MSFVETKFCGNVCDVWNKLREQEKLGECPRKVCVSAKAAVRRLVILKAEIQTNSTVFDNCSKIQLRRPKRLDNFLLFCVRTDDRRDNLFTSSYVHKYVLANMY